MQYIAYVKNYSSTVVLILPECPEIKTRSGTVQQHSFVDTRSKDDHGVVFRATALR